MRGVGRLIMTGVSGYDLTVYRHSLHNFYSTTEYKWLNTELKICPRMAVNNHR